MVKAGVEWGEELDSAREGVVRVGRFANPTRRVTAITSVRRRMEHTGLASVARALMAPVGGPAARRTRNVYSLLRRGWR